MLGAVGDAPGAEAPAPGPVVPDGDVPSSDEPADDPDPPDAPVGPGARGTTMAPFGRLLFGAAAVDELDAPVLPGLAPSWRRTWPTAAAGRFPPLKPMSVATAAIATTATTRAAVRRTRGVGRVTRPGPVGPAVPTRSARSRNSVRRTTRRSGIRAFRDVARTRSSGSPPSGHARPGSSTEAGPGPSGDAEPAATEVPAPAGSSPDVADGAMPARPDVPRPASPGNGWPGADQRSSSVRAHPNPISSRRVATTGPTCAPPHDGLTLLHRQRPVTT